MRTREPSFLARLRQASLIALFFSPSLVAASPLTCFRFFFFSVSAAFSLVRSQKVVVEVSFSSPAVL